MNDAKLAVLTAMEKMISEPLKDAKLEAKDEMGTLFVEHGVTQKRLDLMGEKVGTVSYTAPRKSLAIAPGEEKVALEWLLDNGLAEIKPKAGWEKDFEPCGEWGVAYVPTGEVVPWLVRTLKPGYSTVRLSEKPEKILDMARPMLQDGIAGLLEG